ncbi:hypothetical protein [Micromonospora fulviviridis]|uniref:hypothetical protein n=1 Tax=Micromonospora fulviviridis TaxID=47860 RepID=UPI0037B179A7
MSRDDGRGEEHVVLTIRLYDIETGHVQTLAEVIDAASADAWLRRFALGGLGANDVVYVVDREAGPTRPAVADVEVPEGR